ELRRRAAAVFTVEAEDALVVALEFTRVNLLNDAAQDVHSGAARLESPRSSRFAASSRCSATSGWKALLRREIENGSWPLHAVFIAHVGNEVDLAVGLPADADEAEVEEPSFGVQHCRMCRRVELRRR